MQNTLKITRVEFQNRLKSANNAWASSHDQNMFVVCIVILEPADPQNDVSYVNMQVPESVGRELSRMIGKQVTVTVSTE